MKLDCLSYGNVFFARAFEARYNGFRLDRPLCAHIGPIGICIVNEISEDFRSEKTSNSIPRPTSEVIRESEKVTFVKRVSKRSELTFFETMLYRNTKKRKPEEKNGFLRVWNFEK